MKSTQYSKKVLDHFRKPRNVGTLEGEDVAVGRVGNPVCGDLMEIYIKVKDDKIIDMKFKTFGCGSAIATASMITELAMGKTLDQALRITRNDVASELDGLPPVKMHCSNLAADALKDAIENYLNMKKSRTEVTQEIEQGIKKLTGEDDFLDKGVYYKIDEFSSFKDKRTIIIDNGDKTAEAAIEISKYTPRVVLVTQLKNLPVKSDLKIKLNKTDVKVLYESKIIEIKGVKTVEKVLILDLNEDEKYELFVDAVLIL
jgi:FeS cluster assembly scaffold protein NifU